MLFLRLNIESRRGYHFLTSQYNPTKPIPANKPANNRFRIQTYTLADANATFPYKCFQ